MHGRRLENEVLSVTGGDALDFLQRMTTQDLRDIQEGTTRDTLLVTDKGKLVDWVRVVSHGDTFSLVTSPSRSSLVQEWLERFVIMEDVAFSQNQEVGCFLTDTDTLLPGATVVWQSAVPAMFEQLAGTETELSTELSADEFESTRIRAGVPSARLEFSEQVNPLELRLTARAVSFKKGCYIGQEVISRLDSYDKVARLLMGFVSDTGVFQPGDRVYHPDGTWLGRVTSAVSDGNGTMGLAVVKRAFAQPLEVAVRCDDQDVGFAKLVDCPFWES